VGFRHVDAGRKRDMGLGSFREISREDAERRVEQLREARRNGIDPIQAKRDKAIDRVLSVTFEKAARGFFDAKSKAWSASHRRAWLADLERDVFPAIGSIAVNRIGVPEVLTAIEPGWLVKHETTSRNRGRIEKVLDRAIALKQRPDEPNPARWRGCLDAILALPSDIKKAKGGTRHHAALDWRNVPAFVRQLHQRDDVAARALEFLILTASRSNEVRDARWSEIDLDARLWVIPAERMKARQEHLVPLTDRALAILQVLPRQDDLVFDVGRDAMIDVVKALGGDVQGFDLASRRSAARKPAPRGPTWECSVLGRPRRSDRGGPLTGRSGRRCVRSWPSAVAPQETLPVASLAGGIGWAAEVRRARRW
jgi:integrase